MDSKSGVAFFHLDGKREKIGKNMSHIHGPARAEEHLSRGLTISLTGLEMNLSGEEIGLFTLITAYTNRKSATRRSDNRFSEIGESLLVKTNTPTLEIPGWIYSMRAKELRLKIYYSHVKGI